MTIDRPHWGWPFVRSGTRGVPVVEQDTVEHVSACANMVIRCPVGFRQERPEFGWPFPEFPTMPVDLGPLATALEVFEPRATPDVSQYADAVESAVQHVKVTERVVI